LDHTVNLIFNSILGGFFFCVCFFNLVGVFFFIKVFWWTMETFEKVMFLSLYFTHLVSYILVYIVDPGVATPRIVEFDEPLTYKEAMYF